MGIVHRVVKPCNIIVSRQGRVKILDFGLSKIAGTATLKKTCSTTFISACPLLGATRHALLRSLAESTEYDSKLVQMTLDTLKHDQYCI